MKISKWIKKYPGVMTTSLCLLVGLVVFSQFLLFKKVFLFSDIGSDTITSFYPDLLHLSDYLRETGLPGWSFNVGLGQNNFPGGIQDLSRWPLILLGRGQMAFGVAYVELFKVILSGFLFFRVLRMLRCSIYPSMMGAVLMAFSGYMMVGVTWWTGQSTFIVSAIFLLFAFEKAFSEKKWLWLPVAVACAADACFPFLVEFVVLYTCFRYVDETTLNREERIQIGLFEYGRNFVTLVCKLACYSLLGLVINAFFLSGLVAQLLQSPRVGGEFGLSNVLSATPWFSLASAREYVTMLARLFSTDLLGSGSAFTGWGNYLEAPAFYCGLVTLLLVSQIFFLKSSRRRWASVVFLLIWVLISLLPRLRYAFYFYSGDYYRQGLSLFVPLVFIVMAMRSLSEMLRSERSNGRLIALGITWLIVFGGFLFLFLLSPAGLDLPLLWMGAVLLLLQGVLLGGMMIPTKRRVAMRWFFALVIFEATLFSFCSLNFREAVSGEDQCQKMAGYDDGTMEAVAKIRERDEGFFRMRKDYGWRSRQLLNEGKAQGFFGTSSYHSFNQGNYVRFLSEMGLVEKGNEGATRWLRGVRGCHLLESLLGMKYMLLTQDVEGSYLKEFYQELFTVGDVRVMQNQTALPLCFSYVSFVLEEDLNTCTGSSKQRVLLHSAILETTNSLRSIDIPLGETMYTNSAYTVSEYISCIEDFRSRPVPCVEFSQNRLRFVAFLDEPKILFFSIPFDPGWRATVNGKRMELERVNYGFLGLCLSPGEHVIELEFTPSGFWVFLAISVVGVFLYITLCLRERSSRKRGV